MKKTLSILFSILSLSIMAQVPQGVGYQGVATDANGIELVNQAISIRASVLSGSANGTIEWEETHATSTDTFGLFTLTIGQGTNTTNGLQTSFADISWGTNTYFLKIEMDVTGGSTYSNMGTNQMMSVPYALFAESANINYDSISNFLSGDSTFITNVGSGMGGGGCDYQFPEGLHGDAVIVDVMSGYTVPSGKNLYITSSWADGGQAYLTIGGVHAIQAGNNGSPLIAKSGDIINWITGGNVPNSVLCMGILVDQNPQVQIISIDLMAGNYTVPSSKKMVLYHGYHAGAEGFINVNGQVVFEAWNRPLPLFLNAGDIVSMTGTPTYTSAFGYVVDEDYFAGCSGGGGSTTTSSTSWSSSVPFLQSENWPQGRIGETISINFSIGSSYTVPAGKNLYVGQTYDVGNPEFTISDNLGNSVFMNQSFAPVSVLGEGYTITLTSCFMGACSDFWSGKLIDKQYIEPTIITFSASSLSYTVPSGKVLVSLMYNDFNQSAQEGDWSYNGYLGPNGPSSSNPVEENQTITYVPNSSNPTVPAYIFGYLINY